MRKKAVILTWSGFQDQEVIYPYYRLLEDEFNVDFATNYFGGVDSRTEGNIIGLFGTKFKATIGIIDIEPSMFDLLVLPGGVKALEKLRQEEDALKFIYDFNKAGKTIASICHGAQLLISAKVIAGRQISGYYSIKDDITNAGATYVDAPFVIDDNIVSSPHYKHMGPWMKEVLFNFYDRL
jgi:protease I